MSAADFDPVFQSAGAQYGVDPAALKALAQQESNFNPKAVNPDTGAAGIMQYIPASAKAIGLDPMDPVASINNAAKDFAGNLQRFNGNVEQAVAAHFAGPDQKLWGPKTSQYVSDVASKYAAIKQSGGFAPSPAASPDTAAPAAQPDPVDAMLAQRAQGQPVSAQAPTQQGNPPAAPTDPVGAMLAARAAGQQVPTQTTAATPAPAAQKPSAQQGGLAQDLAAGGGSPDTFNDMTQAGAGAWHGISSLASNAANLVEKGVAAGANAIPGVKGSAVGNWLANTANNDVAAQSAADQQFRQTASPGVQAAGIVAPMVLPMGGAMEAGNALRAGVSALPGMGGTIGRLLGAGLGNAAVGAGLSAGAPVDSNQDYWSQVGHNALTGAGLGAAVPAAAGAVTGAGSAVYNAARPLLDPRGYVGQGLANAVGDDAAQVAGNIRGAPTFVPGSVPTTAQAGANPVLVQTEKAQANASPEFKTAVTQRAIDNNDARWSALMGVAGTPADLQTAQAARAASAQPLYDAAHQSTANVGPAFMRYAQIPEMQEAMQRANDIASLDAAVGRGVPPVWPTPPVPGVSQGSRQINGAALDYTSRALGDMINEAQRTGATTRAGSLSALKSNVDNWMGMYVPGVQQARSAYAAGSVPVNTMEVGQQIANSLGTRGMNAGGAPELQLSPYRTALTQAMRGADHGIDANALGTLQGIGQDLQRSTVSNSIKSPGSDTAYNLSANGWLARRLYGDNFQGGGVGKALGMAAQAGGAAGGAALFGPGGAGVGSALGSGVGAMLNGSRVGNRLGEHLGQLMLNPQGLLPYLDARAATPANPGQLSLGQALGRRLQYLPALAAPQLTGP